MRKANVIFRVDSSSAIGSGHIMRCIALANVLSERGAPCHFICRDHPGNVSGAVLKAGHGLALLPLSEIPSASQGTYAGWLGADLSHDAQDVIVEIDNNAATWLVVDHYAIDAAWESIVKDATGIKVMAIDGQANRKHACDILLDQTVSLDQGMRWKGLVPEPCDMFIGPAHALLRPEFFKAKEALRQREGSVERILIGFGGVDEPNATALVLDAVLSLKRNDIAIDVVVGGKNRHVAQLTAVCEGNAGATLHVDVSDVAELMAASDLAISGGGGMLLEQCHMALPAIIVSIAENQEQQAKALHALGGAEYLGRLEDVSAVDLQSALNGLVDNLDQMRRMQGALLNLVKPEDDRALVDALLAA